MIQLESELYAAAILESDDPHYETVDRGQWISDGKYETRNDIVKHVETGEFYRLCVSRSGSPYSDWFYFFDLNLYRVKEATITITSWVDDEEAK